MVLATTSQGASPGLRLAPCRLPEVKAVTVCGTLEVPENRGKPAGRRISLRVVVIRATGRPRMPDPIFYLVGGPGQAASDSAARAATELGSALSSRDVVLVDQRGTGGSNPLPCRPFPDGDLRGFLGPPPGPADIRRCREELEARADLAHYTSLDAVEDLESVRRALGAGRINLDAGSYGTRVALLYMRTYPMRVRTAALMGVTPPTYRIPLAFARAGQEALDALFAECRADPACSRAYPDIENETRDVLGRLDQAGASVEIVNPDTGVRQTGELSRTLFASRLQLLLFSDALSARIPWLVHRAHTGDYGPFGQLAADFGKAIADQIYFGMQLCVTCSEDLPRIKPEEVDRETAGTFLGAARIVQLEGFCREWVRAPLPPDFAEPVRGGPPTLLLSGARDPASPPRYAEEAARTLSKVRHVVVPRGAHIQNSECLDRIVANVFRRGSVDSLDTSCIDALRPTPFFIPQKREESSRNLKPGSSPRPQAPLGSGHSCPRSAVEQSASRRAHRRMSRLGKDVTGGLFDATGRKSIRSNPSSDPAGRVRAARRQARLRTVRQGLQLLDPARGDALLPAGPRRLAAGDL